MNSDIIEAADSLIESDRFRISQEATDWLTQAAIEVLTHCEEVLLVPLSHGGSVEELAAAAAASEKVMRVARMEIMHAVRQTAFDLCSSIKREKNADAEIRAEWARDAKDEEKYHE